MGKFSDEDEWMRLEKLLNQKYKPTIMGDLFDPAKWQSVSTLTPNHNGQMSSASLGFLFYIAFCKRISA